MCAADPVSLLPFPLRSSSGGGRATGLAGWALTSTTPPPPLVLSAFPFGPDARPGARTHVTLRKSRRGMVSGAKEAGTKLPRTGVLVPASDRRPGPDVA